VHESLPDALARVFAILGIASSIFHYMHFSFFKFIYFKKVLELLRRSNEAKTIMKRFLADASRENINNKLAVIYNNQNKQSAYLTEFCDCNSFVEFVEQKVLKLKYYLFNSLWFLYGERVKEYILIEKIVKEYISIERLYKSKIKMQIDPFIESYDSEKPNKLNKKRWVVKPNEKRNLVLQDNRTCLFNKDKDPENEQSRPK